MGNSGPESIAVISLPTPELWPFVCLNFTKTVRPELLLRNGLQFLNETCCTSLLAWEIVALKVSLLYPFQHQSYGPLFA